MLTKHPLVSTWALSFLKGIELNPLEGNDKFEFRKNTRHFFGAHLATESETAAAVSVHHALNDSVSCSGGVQTSLGLGVRDGGVLSWGVMGLRVTGYGLRVRCSACNHLLY